MKLQHRSVVPADVQWLSGDALLVDTTFALQGEVYQGAGGDTGRDLSGLLRLFDGPESAEGSGQNGKAARAAAQANGSSASSSDSQAEGLRQRKKSSEKEKRAKAPPTEVGGVTIEEVSSNDEDDDDSQNKESKAEAVDNPYADVPTVSEVDAGALVLDTGGGAKGFATCRVLRVGASSHGWVRAAQVRDQTSEWRRAKRPTQLPHLCGSWSTLLVCVVVAWMVPALLRARAVQGPPRSFLALVVAFFKTLQSSLEEITGMSLADLLPNLSLPSFLAEMPDDVSFNDLNNGTGGANAATGGSEKGSSDGSNEGLVALADLVGS